VKKVLHVIDSLDLGGAQTLLLDICKHTDHSRFDVQVACMHGRGVFADEFEKAGINVHSLSPSKWPPRYIPNFIGLLGSLDPDIIHFHLFGSNFVAKPLAALLGRAALIVHDHTNADSRLHSPLLLVADTLTNRFSTRVIAVAESVRELLIEREGLCDDRVITLPNGVDAEMFLPSTLEQREVARASLRLPEGAFVVGGVGRLAEVKNLKVFLKVAAKFLERNPGAVFVIAGMGPLEGSLRELADSLKIAGSVHFLGHLSDRVELYRALDVLLITSDAEGTPMTLLEAMSCGLPVISSAVGGIPEVAKNEREALLVPARDAQGFVSALERVLGEEGLTRKLGGNARSTILERYEIRGLVRRIEALYETVLEEER